MDYAIELGELFALVLPVWCLWLAMTAAWVVCWNLDRRMP